MIGPIEQSMPNKKICTGCDALVSKELGGTERFPKKWTSYYCSHPDLENEISFIKNSKARTPIWCPVVNSVRKV
jgi:hypothetical protein